MAINADLHSHSGYAGGVGSISLQDIEKTMILKGIDVFGTGDCLHPKWNSHLKDVLAEKEEGIFSLKESSTPKRFLLQTEIIITAKLESSRKLVHTLVLFPSFESISKAVDLLESSGMKNTVGRPFLKCEDNHDVSRKLGKLMDIDDMIEVVPAHVMTPQGVYGSNNPIYFMKDFYGSVYERFSAVETGLSADPVILNMIPELDSFSLISNSDTHSAALNRVGREFTSFDIDNPSYSSIIRCLRKRKVLKTAEFNPEEGRFFLTGHRMGKKGHDASYCVFSPKNTPEGKMCPICKKRLTVGVLEQAMLIGEMQGEPRTLDSPPSVKRDFISMVPLTEIIAYYLGIKNCSSPKVYSIYMDIIKAIGSEAQLWLKSSDNIERSLSGIVDPGLVEKILSVKKGRFGFDPPGFDGTYGSLVIGKNIDFLDVNTVSYGDVENRNAGDVQKKLF